MPVFYWPITTESNYPSVDSPIFMVAYYSNAFAGAGEEKTITQNMKETKKSGKYIIVNNTRMQLRS